MAVVQNLHSGSGLRGEDRPAGPALNAAGIAAVSMMALVCFSLVYLGLHYVSDVVGGVTEGIAWLVLTVTALRYFRHRNAAAADGQ